MRPTTLKSENVWLILHRLSEILAKDGTIIVILLMLIVKFVNIIANQSKKVYEIIDNSQLFEHNSHSLEDNSQTYEFNSQ